MYSAQSGKSGLYIPFPTSIISYHDQKSSPRSIRLQVKPAAVRLAGALAVSAFTAHKPPVIQPNSGLPLLFTSASVLKRNALTAPFERAFEIQKALKANPSNPDVAPTNWDPMALKYRPEEEIYANIDIDGQYDFSRGY
ncbi:hypothetical protein PTTG_07013 [Puccinia triticina 1-1 BBBD Race 1]|uniref:Arp2/3 complex 34 kDa subunit n=2 Tax=Puccinia triticina TaxID=208348 RepID=A0A0C4F1P2_PUCT1|nr:uncharacterized protein PtA15_10A324 [Puccinia triticina]OAV89013.1 hypothetical protein PTTG_07013 [Puccinia triticina 1-1 BBBD Race 1]WAQ88902.1 hypothetical protein PtA15_10A324 [Puccinia triticina]WAR58958.1 hypothetical protein PtB15_10B299 [Puccinia triticina]